MTKNKIVYTCPHCKEAPKDGAWRRSYEWKTKRGFDNHKCYKEESEQAHRRKQDQEQERTRKAVLMELFREWLKLELTDHKIGDLVYFVAYDITLPTHEKRGSRVVKVRHEKERHYFAGKTEVVGFAPLNDGRDLDKEDIAYAIQNKRPYPHRAVIGGRYNIVKLCKSWDEAEKLAKHEQDSYNRHCKDSARYR